VRKDFSRSLEITTTVSSNKVRDLAFPIFEGERRSTAKNCRKLGKELQKLARKKRPATITILYGARDTEHNNAVALNELLEDLFRSDAEPECINCW
jgi:uncharacterized protein YeaO (DUF488 family)